MNHKKSKRIISSFFIACIDFQQIVKILSVRCIEDKEMNYFNEYVHKKLIKILQKII